MGGANSSQNYSNDGALAWLVRLYWMFIGNCIVMFSGISIALNKSQTFLTGLDGVYFLGALGLITFRAVDIKLFNGNNSDGQPASMADFWKYFRNVLFFTTAIWGLAHFLKSVLV